MYQVVLIGLGGFIGAVMRFLLSGWVQSGFGSFPIGTLFVNFTGTLGLSTVMYLSEYGGLFSSDVRMFLTVGIMGAFTTMSTFGYESLRLLEQSEILLFIENIVGTLILVMLAAYLGKMMAVTMWRL
ncbi:fluoride efflux transporter CrcB [Methermicoccus shengliensis]|uniref:Fluoride-specific ion channel FluC n=1 Tax=Methermicoccus shengliensis TaxID=660064 RepID=A0A832RVM6_9EURY|nr:fluoride efflux transporter CrcB [Methermicoccus shengliensis]KUK04922.1 MAG: Protein CrcB-like protein [Euryarchaeota archaeon 55_53]KUK30450.1 MAG: Protein CrcB-like protein [Methanosarcinales archeaon 56_1174]MDI3488649.1 fluoride exporter [Methanosarcinales archaeon]MDN5295296.1 fluoride exporter [Methanosarcinales archaeon]HIH69615.1 fluoride efflux transporter CrcB [Methermicoccus shengliensis]